MCCRACRFERGKERGREGRKRGRERCERDEEEKKKRDRLENRASVFFSPRAAFSSLSRRFLAPLTDRARCLRRALPLRSIGGTTAREGERRDGRGKKDSGRWSVFSSSSSILTKLVKQVVALERRHGVGRGGSRGCCFGFGGSSSLVLRRLLGVGVGHFFFRTRNDGEKEKERREKKK